MYTDPELIYNAFINKFKQIFDEAFPLISACTNLNSKTNRHNPWMTPSLVKCCKIKSKLFKTHK